MGDAGDAFCAGYRPGVYIAFHIEAVVIAQSLHIFGGLLRHPDADGDLGRAAGGEGNLIAVYRFPGVSDFRTQGNHFVGGEVVSFPTVLCHQGIGGQDRGVQIVGQRIAGEVVQSKGKAPALITVAQLSLDLSVRLAVYQEEGLGVDGVSDVGQAGALVPYGVFHTACFFHQGLRGGHEQRLGQRPGGERFVAGDGAGLGKQVMFPDVLAHQSSQAGDMGRCHGSTGHHLVLIGSGAQAVDRIDLAAGGGDLRLNGQAAGGTPGGKIAHGGVLYIFTVIDVKAGGDFHRGRVQAVFIFVAQGEDGLGVFHGQSAAGYGGGGAFDGTAERAGDVVVDQHSGGAGGGCNFMLGREVDVVPAGNQDHLAGKIIAVEIRKTAGVDPVVGLRSAGKQGGGISQEHYVVGGTCSIGVQRCPGQIHPVGRHFNGGFPRTAKEGFVFPDGAHVVYAGNGEGVGEGTGVGDHGGAGFVGVQVLVGVVMIRPVTGVTGGDAQHQAGLNQFFHNAVDIGRVRRIRLMGGVKTGVGCAQRQVDRIAAQHNGVLHGGHVVAGISAAVDAEDFHGQQLGVGRYAADAYRLFGGHVINLIGQLLQQQVHVIGADAAVAAQVRMLLMGDFGALDYVVH